MASLSDVATAAAATSMTTSKNVGAHCGTAAVRPVTEELRR